MIVFLQVLLAEKELELAFGIPDFVVSTTTTTTTTTTNFVFFQILW